MPIHGMLEPQNPAGGQRGDERVRMRLEAPGSLEQGEGTTVVIHNLSASGMLIETASDLDVGQHIMVALPEAPDVSATVVWRSGALAGCRFDQPLPRRALSAAQLRNPLPTEIDPARDGAGAYETLPQRLFRLRHERGLSRAALSERTGFSRPSIWAWETGKTVPRRGNLVTLADVFGLGVDDLIFGDVLALAHGAVPAAGQERVRDAVQSSRERIAAAAGVEPDDVKISIEY